MEENLTKQLLDEIQVLKDLVNMTLNEVVELQKENELIKDLANMTHNEVVELQRHLL